MKKYLFTILFLAFLGFAKAQDSYWVFFTDKNNTSFNPYEYFDAKAIDRYKVNHADLYDITNYPVNADYEEGVSALVTENVGSSRWLNAIGVVATAEQIAQVQSLPFVARVQPISTEALPTEFTQTAALDPSMTQVSLMEGEKFQQKGINGKGVRIAVFDGGFPEVDTHPAFKHLRDNHQIVKTWNFANKKENVYDYNSHGRMVLSCIAGIMNDTTMLGLAPGAEFLLARTEVTAEKRREEIWWVQALEWADQNGASIVSSSLGYGKELHNLKDMDGQTSIVAKGAATAASKGILVCTAMGNEGDEKEWKMLVTPADADGVLSVGAVNSLENLESYSSFGPTADGRRKPNVVACGNDMVASSKGNFTKAHGTSFATPMVSGFAACVKQMHPDWTALQLLEEIEKSANHYPYYDYAFGYGVPQAGYFTDAKKESKHTFDLFEDEQNLYVMPVNHEENHKLFYNIQNGDGSLYDYNTKVFNIENSAGNQFFSINKMFLKEGQAVNIWYDDQYAQYVVGKDKVQTADTAWSNNNTFSISDFLGCGSTAKPSNDIYSHRPKIYSGGLALNASFMVPSMWTPNGNIHQTDRVSRSLTFSFVNNWQVSRVYGLGFRIGFGSSWYALKENTNPNMAFSLMELDLRDGELRKHNLKISKFDLEFTQRFILSYLPSTKCYLEAGVFGEWNTGSRLKTKTIKDGQVITLVEKDYFRSGMNKLDCGVRLRLGFTNWFALYGQYRITPVMKIGTDLPQWEVGIQLF